MVIGNPNYETIPMRTLFLKIRTYLFVAILTNIAWVLPNDRARAFDMDCTVILCIAGGFPAGCADAYAYMISRITRFHPLPPFGFCPMSNGLEYTAHNVDYQLLHRGPDAYDCPIDTTLFYSLTYEEHGQETETAFCYSHTTSERFGFGRDQEYRTVYHNQSSPQRINFQLRITIEPGTEQEYHSPFFRINTSTGYFSQSAL